MTAITIKVDLRPLFGPARDQGARPTCLAFAASDLHTALRGNQVPLSCEYVFFHAQQRSGRPPTKGACLPTMLLTIRDNGQPTEETWPYLAQLPANMSRWKPPSGNYDLFRRGGEEDAHKVDAVIAQLDQGIPVLLLLYLSRSFYRPASDGLVDCPPGEIPDANVRHAVIAVAHGLAGSQRAVLVRNSWGQNWGLEGYAWLTETFLQPRAYRLAILKEEIRVSSHSAAA